MSDFFERTNGSATGGGQYYIYGHSDGRETKDYLATTRVGDDKIITSVARTVYSDVLEKGAEVLIPESLAGFANKLIGLRQEQVDRIQYQFNIMGGQEKKAVIVRYSAEKPSRETLAAADFVTNRLEDLQDYSNESCSGRQVDERVAVVSNWAVSDTVYGEHSCAQREQVRGMYDEYGDAQLGRCPDDIASQLQSSWNHRQAVVQAWRQDFKSRWQEEFRRAQSEYERLDYRALDYDKKRRKINDRLLDASYMLRDTTCAIQPSPVIPQYPSSVIYDIRSKQGAYLPDLNAIVDMIGGIDGWKNKTREERLQFIEQAGGNGGENQNFAYFWVKGTDGSDALAVELHTSGSVEIVDFPVNCPNCHMSSLLSSEAEQIQSYRFDDISASEDYNALLQESADEALMLGPSTNTSMSLANAEVLLSRPNSDIFASGTSERALSKLFDPEPEDKESKFEDECLMECEHYGVEKLRALLEYGSYNEALSRFRDLTALRQRLIEFVEQKSVPDNALRKGVGQRQIQKILPDGTERYEDTRVYDPLLDHKLSVRQAVEDERDLETESGGLFEDPLYIARKYFLLSLDHSTVQNILDNYDEIIGEIDKRLIMPLTLDLPKIKDEDAAKYKGKKAENRAVLRRQGLLSKAVAELSQLDVPELQGGKDSTSAGRLKPGSPEDRLELESCDN